MSESLALDVISSLRLGPGGLYLGKDVMTQLRHRIAMDVILMINDYLAEMKSNCHEEKLDPVSYLMSDAHVNSIPTEGKNLDPFWAIISILTHPYHNYWRYYNAKNEECHLWWKEIDYLEKANRKVEGKEVVEKGGKAYKRDSYFLMKPDKRSTGYMGAAAAHATVEDLKSDHIIEIYYSVKYFARRERGTDFEFGPFKNDWIYNWAGGYGGNPNEKKTTYVNPKDHELFGIEIINFFDLWTASGTNWSWPSYQNLMCCILLMEHELHHAMIGRYFPVMYSIEDLLMKKDIDGAGPAVETLKQRYLEQHTALKRNEKTTRRKSTWGQVQLGNGRVHNPLSNINGHNMWFGMFTYRSGLLGCEVTIEATKKQPCSYLMKYDVLKTDGKKTVESMDVDELFETLNIKF
jgi:hypothetical protein